MALICDENRPTLCQTRLVTDQNRDRAFRPERPSLLRSSQAQGNEGGNEGGNKGGDEGGNKGGDEGGSEGGDGGDGVTAGDGR